MRYFSVLVGCGLVHSDRGMRLLFLSAWSLLAVTMVAPSIRAQGAPLVPRPGDWVRVLPLDTANAWVTGRVTGIWPDSIVLDAPLSVEWSQVRKVDVRTAVEHRGGTGALVGLALGGVAGVASFASARRTTCGDAALCPLLAGGVVTLGGVALGALIGAFVRTEIWRVGRRP